MLMHDSDQLNQSFCVIFFKGCKEGGGFNRKWLYLDELLQNVKHSNRQLMCSLQTIKPKCELVRMGLQGIKHIPQSKLD